MSDAPLTTPAYTALHDAVLFAIEAGKSRAQQAVEQEKIRTGWTIGKLLHQHLLKHKDRAEYGERVMAQLADDMGMREQRLYEMLTFHRTFPILRSIGEFNLNWTHYLKLLKLPTPEIRDYYIEQTHVHAWSVRDLQEAIREKVHENIQAIPPTETERTASAQQKQVLTPRRGQLNIYRIDRIDGQKRMINLGFFMSRFLRTIGPVDPYPGMIVSTTRMVSEIDEDLILWGGLHPINCINISADLTGRTTTLSDRQAKEGFYVSKRIWKAKGRIRI